MLVFNSVSNDPRVRREAAGLVTAGYEVIVIGIHVGARVHEEWMHRCHVIRIPLPRCISWVKSEPRVLRSARRLYSLARDVVQTTLSSSKQPQPSPEYLNGRSENSQQPPAVLSKACADILNIAYVMWMNVVMAKEAIKQQADVYHAHDLDTLLGAYIAKRLTGKVLVYDFHELFTEQYKKGTKTSLWHCFYARLERFLVKRTDLRLTVCDSLGTWMGQRYGINGAMTVRNVPPYQKSPTGGTGSRPERVILYHGRYLPDRGLEQLIESARYLKSGRILLRGEGDLGGKLRALVKEKGLEHRITLVPPVPMPDLVKIAVEADIGVIPYLPFCLNNRFCLPNKLFEYMMAGLAIAGSDLPELRRVIVGHQLGEVFDPQDPQDIARALNAMLEQDARLEDMKRNALEAARKFYNWESEEKILLKGYEAVLQHEGVGEERCSASSAFTGTR